MISINANAPVTCNKSILINAKNEKVWEVMTDIDKWANWQTDINSPQLKGPLLPGTTFKWKTGGAKINSTLHTVTPFYYFGWTGTTFGMKAIHNWTLSSSDGQTRVFVEESMEGFFAMLLKKSFNKNLEKGMQHWLESLKRECEK